MLQLWVLKVIGECFSLKAPAKNKNAILGFARKMLAFPAILLQYSGINFLSLDLL